MIAGNGLSYPNDLALNFVFSILLTELQVLVRN